VELLPNLLVSQAEEGPGAFGPLLTIGLMFAIVYFMMIRPQGKQQKEHADFLSTLAKGSEVVTSGGIVGKVHSVAADSVVVEIAKDVRVQVAKNHLYAWKPVAAVASNGAAGKDSKDSKEAAEQKK